MKKSTRNVIIIVVVLLVAIVAGFKMINSPHEMTTGQVLQKFDWTLRSKETKQNLGNVSFNNKNMVITKGDSKYSSKYSLNSDDDLTIKDGQYAGKYTMKMDSTDYSLVPNQKNQDQLELIRK